MDSSRRLLFEKLEACIAKAPEPAQHDLFDALERFKVEHGDQDLALALHDMLESIQDGLAEAYIQREMVRDDADA